MVPTERVSRTFFNARVAIFHDAPWIVHARTIDVADRLQRNRRVAVKGAAGAAFTSGGGRATSKEFVVADGHHTAQVVAIYLARRASTRLPYLPVSTSAPRPCSLLLLAHPFPRSSPAITHTVVVCPLAMRQRVITDWPLCINGNSVSKRDRFVYNKNVI